MPLIRIDKQPSGAMLGLWEMNESIEQLLYAYPSLHALLPSLEHYRSDVRKLEKLAVHALLQEMTGLSNPVVNHNPDGRPIFEGWEISVSHTRGIATVILHKNDDNNLSSLSPVAIDIEYISDRVSRITSRFLRPDEEASTLLHQLVCWCAKETAYKFFSSQHLELLDMRILPFELSAKGKGTIFLENLKTQEKIDIVYQISERYVLTYTC